MFCTAVKNCRWDAGLSVVIFMSLKTGSCALSSRLNIVHPGTVLTNTRNFGSEHYKQKENVTRKAMYFPMNLTVYRTLQFQDKRTENK
jgi:hypothetical protein